MIKNIRSYKQYIDFKFTGLEPFSFRIKLSFLKTFLWGFIAIIQYEQQYKLLFTVPTDLPYFFYFQLFKFPFRAFLRLLSASLKSPEPSSHLLALNEFLMRKITRTVKRADFPSRLFCSRLMFRFFLFHFAAHRDGTSTLTTFFVAHFPSLVYIHKVSSLF